MGSYDTYAMLRACGGPDGKNCGAQYVGACAQRMTPPETPSPEHVCARPSWAWSGDSVFDDCMDGAGSVRPQVLTTFLAAPCDLVQDGNVCATGPWQ